MNTNQERNSKVIKALIDTLTDKLGNGLVPLSYCVEKIAQGERLNSEQVQNLTNAYENVEQILKWLRTLKASKIQETRYESSVSGLILFFKCL